MVAGLFWLVSKTKNNSIMLETPFIRFLIVIVCGGLFILCDSLAAHWGKNNSINALIAVILIAPLSYILFGYLNQRYALSVISAWTVLVICIGTVLVGIFFFHDQLTLKQSIGLFMAIISITLLI